MFFAYYEAVDRGVVPERQEWLKRFPDLRDELAEFFDDQDQLLQIVAPLKQAIHGEEPARTMAGEREREGTRNCRCGLPPDVTLGGSLDQEMASEVTGKAPGEPPALTATQTSQSDTRCDPCFCQPDSPPPGRPLRRFPASR